MRNRFVKYTVGVLAGVVIVSSSQMGVLASPGAGLTDYTDTITTASTVPTAGVSLAFAESIISKGQSTTVASNGAPILKADYAEYAVAQVKDYVNIRKKADENSSALGKMYDGSIARVLDESKGWYKIESGSIVGFVKKKYVVVGDAKLIESVGMRVATVTSDGLNIRTKASVKAKVLASVNEGARFEVIGENNDDWVKIKTNEGNGYVATEYVSLETEYKYAVSKEEEEEAAKNSSVSELGSIVGNRGQEVIDYACQFVGNPYKWGGTSLTNGADCSGFVLSVYGKYGYSLPHSSYDLRSVGTKVSTSDMQPGDIVCFPGHVALYMGDGMIVHAANSKLGIIKSDLNFGRIVTVRRLIK